VNGVLKSARRTLFPRVRDAVKAPAVVVKPDQSLEVVVRRMRGVGAETAVVHNERKILGVVSDEKVLEHLLQERTAWGETPVHDVMDRQIIVMNADATLDAAAEALRGRDGHRVIVVEGSDVLGVVRREDIRLASPRAYRSPLLLAKRFLVDTLAYISFWTLPLAFVQLYIVRLSVPQFLTASAMGFVVTLLLAGGFGGYLDFVRAKFGVGAQ
jgi:predicted transcriptional regulator